MEAQKRVSDQLLEVVIPNWNGKKLLSECLDSLRRQTYQSFQVIVVDNGSTDGSVEFIKKAYPEVELVEYRYNSGFSKAVNKGVLSGKAKWILLLNNDMEVASDCFEQLMQATARYDDYDFFALKMINYNQREYLDGAGEAVLRGGVGYRIGTMEKNREEYNHDRDCFGACGGAALYRRDVFARAGLFDEDFFAYLEDVDLNMRAARLGLRCRYLASAVVYHIGSASTGSKFNPVTIKLSTRNSLHLIAKNYPPGLIVRFLLPLIIYQFMWFCFCCKKGLVRPYLAGMKEGIQKYSFFREKRAEMEREEPLRFLTVTEFAQKITKAENEAIESIMARRNENGKGNSLLKLYRFLFL